MLCFQSHLRRTGCASCALKDVAADPDHECWSCVWLCSGPSHPAVVALALVGDLARPVPYPPPHAGRFCLAMPPSCSPKQGRVVLARAGCRRHDVARFCGSAFRQSPAKAMRWPALYFMKMLLPSPWPRRPAHRLLLAAVEAR
jgi:hypothetical protein